MRNGYNIVHTKTRNELEQAGTTWNELEPTGTTWNKVEPPVTRWTQQRTDTKEQEIPRKKLCVQYHCPIEYNISNSYCHEWHHLRCLQVEPPGTEWNQ